MRFVLLKRVYLNGKKIHEQPCDSFLYNLVALLCNSFGGSANVIDIDGNNIDERMIWHDWFNTWYTKTVIAKPYFVVNAPEGDDSYGLIVGRSNIPELLTDRMLRDKIPHGSEDGKLYYRECTVSDVIENEDGFSITISRQFVNYGTVNIEVGEMGLAGKGAYGKSVLIIRDIWNPKVVVESDDIATFEFEIQIKS